MAKLVLKITAIMWCGWCGVVCSSRVTAFMREDDDKPKDPTPWKIMKTAKMTIVDNSLKTFQQQPTIRPFFLATREKFNFPFSSLELESPLWLFNKPLKTPWEIIFNNECLTSPALMRKEKQIKRKNTQWRKKTNSRCERSLKNRTQVASNTVGIVHTYGWF